MALPLAGKTALVTGGGIRVGRAISLALAGAGAGVAIHYRSSRSEAESAAEKITAAGGRAELVNGDVARPEDCRRIVRESLAVFGGLDFLVHSAANFHRASIEETDEDLWDSAMDVNARAGFLLAREAAPVLRERRGRIVLLSDFLAESPARNYLAHSVSKAAVEGLVRALAVELAPEVSVNGVAPGTVLPPEGTSADEIHRLARRVPAKRIGSAEDVGAAVLFLCAGPAFVTGQVLRVDGGRSIV
ncbi:MAG TPA: SDR family oxidoreductase [Thermoanaerobaculia bacterium]|jgi:pteridine reductase